MPLGGGQRVKSNSMFNSALNLTFGQQATSRCRALLAVTLKEACL